MSDHSWYNVVMDGRIDPTRIILARRLKRLSKTQLAKTLDVSQATVGLWEDGARDATGSISQIAKALGQPEKFFTGSDVPVTESSSVTFRKRQSATRASRDRAASAIDMAAGVLLPAVASVFERFPEPDVPDFCGLSPEAAAEATRRHWGLGDGPIKNMVAQLEARGVRVFWVTEENPALSAFCRWVDGQPFVILNTAKRDGCRSRFDAAHELAHLVLHRDTDFDKADARIYEGEADAFASAFLMPKATFTKGMPNIFDHRLLLSKKKVWGVSVQAMVRRLKDAGVLAPWQYERAYKRMSAWGWRSNAEPLAGEMELSHVHWKLCDRLAEEDIDPMAYAEKVGVSWETIEEMMPVLAIRQMNLRLAGVFDDAPPLNLDSPNLTTLPFND